MNIFFNIYIYILLYIPLIQQFFNIFYHIKKINLKNIIFYFFNYNIYMFNYFYNKKKNLKLFKSNKLVINDSFIASTAVVNNKIDFIQNLLTFFFFKYFKFNIQLVFNNYCERMVEKNFINYNKFNNLQFDNIFYYTFKNLDVRLFNNWLSYILNTLPVYHHKIILKKLKIFLLKYFRLQNNTNNVCGFKILISGKIGGLKNLKTRRYLIFVGNLGKNKRITKLVYDYSQVKTQSGSLGCWILCYFY